MQTLLNILIKLVPSLFSEKLVGTLVRHGLNAIGSVLITVIGVNPQIVADWKEASLAIGVAVALYLLSFIGSRVYP